MIKDGGKYYLYRHIRLDTGEVFYVGIGKVEDRHLNKDDRHARAYSHRYRNRFWKAIVAKADFSVDILLESDDRDFIQEKEREFIRIYGRRDMGTGTLCNLTDGGDNGLNRSKFAIQKQIATAKKNGTYQKQIERIRKYAPKKGQKGSHVDRKTFMYRTDGTFAGEFSSRRDCGEHIRTTGEAVTGSIRLQKSHKGYVFFDSFMGDTVDLSGHQISRDKARPVNKLHPITKELLERFPSLTEAAKSVSSTKKDLFKAIKRGIRRRNFYWCYAN